jgi:hypothetical protein
MIASGPAFATGPFPQSPSTSQGPVTITGITGDLRTVALPDASGQALLQANGNGTSTLVDPDGHREVVITPQ